MKIQETQYWTLTKGMIQAITNTFRCIPEQSMLVDEFSTFTALDKRKSDKKIFLVPSAYPIFPVHNIGNFPANEVKNNMSFKFHLQKRNTHQSNKDVGQSQRKTKG